MLYKSSSMISNLPLNANKEWIVCCWLPLNLNHRLKRIICNIKEPSFHLLICQIHRASLVITKASETISTGARKIWKCLSKMVQYYTQNCILKKSRASAHDSAKAIFLEFAISTYTAATLSPSRRVQNEWRVCANLL